MKVSEEFKEGKNNIGKAYPVFLEEYGDDEVADGNVLTPQILGRDVFDSQVIKEKGLEECSVADILATMQKPTPNMMDGGANLFYVKGHTTVVLVNWRDGGWNVSVHLQYNILWPQETRVFFRKTDA